MYLAFNNDSIISFNITVCCTFMKCHILPSCVHFTKLFILILILIFILILILILIIV